MFAILSDFFQKNNIRLVSAIPLDVCNCRKPYLLEREGITDGGTAILFAVPYRTPTCDLPERNISAYAVSKDYHGYFDSLFEKILPVLREAFPTEKFAGFSDHSPIDEVDAAARAGLGILGDNGLLITEDYSSFVFLGEICTSARLPAHPREPVHCEGCGACKRICPATNGVSCLSALTQKKGELTEEEQSLLRACDTVWGCDLCQDVCPHTVRALRAGTVYTEIPYFYDTPIPRLSLTLLDGMSDAEFSARAYAWRRRETVARNLKTIRKGDSEC